MGSLMQRTVKELLNVYDKTLDKVSPEDLCKIVKFHGLGAAATSAGAGLLPGVGSVACTAVYAGFVWSMYGRLGKAIGLPFNKHILKSLAAGVASNLAATAATTLVATAVVSLIPGIGSVAASALDAALGYAVVSSAGILYMKLLIKLAKSKKDPLNLSAEELSDVAKETMKETDVKGILKTMKNEYKEVKDEKISIDESDADEYSDEFDEQKIKNALGLKNVKVKNIAVCATMSAGKTTFVNALLGSDVLPSRNEATTAKVTSVYDKDDASNISGFITKGKTILDKSDNVTPQTINEWNDNSLVERIYLQGDLDNITSKKFVCAIHDTPGTNNSGDNRHHDITFGFLEENDLSAIIYVANCEHLCTNDDESLLKELFERVICKRNIPVLFILNKADRIDQEKESQSKIFTEYKQFLNKIGYENFKLFPFSAKNARLFKMAIKNRADLFTESEMDDFSVMVKKFSKGTDLTGGIIDYSDNTEQITVDGESYNYAELNTALAHTGLRKIEEEIEKIIEEDN